MRKHFFPFLIFILCVSCVTPSISKDKVITAYMPSGNMKYYIRPSKMILKEGKNGEESLMADITYQMLKREYVTDGYFNFTLHNKTSAFVEKVELIIGADKIIPLTNIITLDRNAIAGFIRVSTILEKENIKMVLEALHSGNAVLKIILDNEDEIKFISSKMFMNNIAEAFSK